MRKVELVDGIHSSVLGFGCAPILGSKSANDSRRALEAAFDKGITHFDLARSYGYGEAEGFVGKVLRKKRDKIVFTSKFGIQANWKAQLFKPVKPVVRFLRSRKAETIESKPLDKNENKVADLFHDRIEINAIEMRKNLERSLKALKTDYLDYFLIHEPLAAIENIDELSNTMLSLKKEGKIRAWGLAFVKNQKHLHESYLDRFDILQFNNSPVDNDYNKVVEERSNESNIFFSTLRGGAEMSPAEKLKRLLNDYSRSVILCSMYSVKHLEENVKLAT
ncbi:MAG: aldo/keto reductase [Bacteroidota bacterium]|nr:aldo/keto reductase [Bacteroidota bacterium]